MTASEMPDYTWIDLSDLHTLARGSNRFVLGMIAIYQEDFPAYLEQLKAACERGHYSEVRNLGHRMKSPASSVRALALFEKLTYFENFGPSEAAQWPAHFERLVTLHQAANHELEQERARLGHANAS